MILFVLSVTRRRPPNFLSVKCWITQLQTQTSKLPLGQMLNHATCDVKVNCCATDCSGYFGSIFISESIRTACSQDKLKVDIRVTILETVAFCLIVWLFDWLFDCLIARYLVFLQVMKMLNFGQEPGKKFFFRTWYWGKFRRFEESNWIVK